VPGDLSPGTEPRPRRETHNEVRDSDPDLLVQADTIHGGLNLRLPSEGQERVPPRQLPAAPVGAVGREDELRRVVAHLCGGDGGGPPSRSAPVVTITGAGGMGKTWFAMSAAHGCADRFPDGQLFADLGGFDATREPVSPAVVLREFLDALGVPPNQLPDGEGAQTGLLRSMLADRSVLMVLDNARDTAQVAPLLPAGPRCAVIVTSRRTLIGLDVRHGARHLALEVLPAVQAQRMMAAAIGPDRMVFERQAVDTLVSACGGLPLAIALVAGRAQAHRSFPLSSLADEFAEAADRLDALETDDAGTGLRVVMSGSYAALSAPAARVFRLLGLAPGPDVGVEAAKVLTGLTGSRCRSLLRALENAHLLEEHRPGRFRMHELVRLYAAERAEEEESSPEQHLLPVIDHYTRIASVAAQVLAPHRPPPFAGADDERAEAAKDVSAALTWFDDENLCLLAALRSAARLGWHEAVWRLTWAVDGYYWRRGDLRANLAAWSFGLTAAESMAQPALLALSHLRYGQLCQRLGQREEAARHLGRALTLAGRNGDPPGQARIHRALAFVLGSEDQCEEALRHAEHALGLFRSAGDARGESEALGAVAWFHARLGHLDEGRTTSDQALVLSRSIGYRVGEAVAMGTSAYLDWHAGRLANARLVARQTLVLYREIGDKYWEAELLDGIAGISHELELYAEARDAWQQALVLYREQLRATRVQRVEEMLGNTSDPTGETG
jgi:tetratricopeptide (TPR) repeat protein